MEKVVRHGGGAEGFDGLGGGVRQSVSSRLRAFVFLKGRIELEKIEQFANRVLVLCWVPHPGPAVE